MDPSSYYRYYSSPADRNDRLIYLSTTDYEVQGIDKNRDTPLSITDMFVIPSDEDAKRKPWILLSYVVATDDDQDGSTDSIPLTQTQRIDVCAGINIQSFIRNLGDIVEDFPHRCNLNGFFETMRQSSIIPVLLPSPRIETARLLLIPTVRSGSVEACILTLSFFQSLTRISEGQGKVCFNTPESFSTNANFPTRPGWIDFQKTMFMGSEEAVGSSPSVTQQGVTVFVRRIVSQNSLSGFSLEDASKNMIQFFGTGIFNVTLVYFYWTISH
jgi:hypothetical protein